MAALLAEAEADAAAMMVKGQYPIFYADAFAAALAQKHKCRLVTGDPEFATVKHLNLDWIGDTAKPD